MLANETRPTWTEKHRHECEVRYVAAMRSRSRIKAYVDGVAKVRGEEAANRLWNDFVKLVKPQSNPK